MSRRDPLATPRSRKLAPFYDQDAFGRFAETIARTLGTARFLVIQSVVVAIWVAVNVAFLALRWDPYPFILLNLMFSVQAAYAAPLILLAQNRQEERDRRQAENDRAIAAATQANAEYLARELASVRLALSSIVTIDELREQLDETINRLERRTGN